MFSQITWEQYFAHTAVAGLLYYLSVLILYYRSDFKLFFNGSKSARTGLSASALQEQSIIEVLGKVAVSTGSTTVSSEQLNFSTPAQPEEASNHASLYRQEEVGKFVERLKESVTILEEANGSKEELAILFKMALSKHPVLLDTSLNDDVIQASLTLLNKSNFDFEIGGDEIRNFWK